MSVSMIEGQYGEQGLKLKKKSQHLFHTICKTFPAPQAKS